MSQNRVYGVEIGTLGLPNVNFQTDRQILLICQFGWSAALCLLFLTGCAHKQVAHEVIPASCILGAEMQGPPCRPIGKDAYSCDHVVVKAVCVKVKK